MPPAAYELGSYLHQYDKGLADKIASSLAAVDVRIDDPDGVLGVRESSEVGKQATLHVGNRAFTIHTTQKEPEVIVGQSRADTVRQGVDSEYYVPEAGPRPRDPDFNFLVDTLYADYDALYYLGLASTTALMHFRLVIGYATGGYYDPASLPQQMVTKFYDGDQSDFNHPDGSQLSEAVRSSRGKKANFDKLTKDVKYHIQHFIDQQARGGVVDPDKLDDVIYLYDNFHFGGSGPFLAYTLGGTQKAEVKLTNFEADGDVTEYGGGGSGTYRGLLQFHFYDDFGVDEGDVKSTVLQKIRGFEFDAPFGVGVAPMYYLQHELDGHRPFVNHVTVTVPIEGRFTIPSDYTAVKKVS